MKPKHVITLGLLFFSTVTPQLSLLFAQGTAFTYQGRLNDGLSPANGIYDLRFSIYDAAIDGATVGGPLTNAATAVSNGLFTVTLDFGASAFDGNARWLEIAVRPQGGAASYTILSPRQLLASTPYAVRAAAAGTASTAAIAASANSVSAANITGLISETQLPANIALLSVSNTAVQATANPIITSGFVTGATITSGGSGYVTAPLVTIDDASGLGAGIVATLSNGMVVALSVTNAGSGYTPGATLTIAPPPSNAYQVFQSTNYFGGVNTLTNPNNVVAGNGSGVTALNASQLASGLVPDARLPATIARTSQVWLLGGNSGTTAGTHFVGTTDNQPLEFRVDGRRAARLEPTTDVPGRSNLVNVVNGSSVNFVAPGVRGATVSGGGAGNYDGIAYTNSVAADLGTIAGGVGNTIRVLSDGSSIGGGSRNRVLGAYNATIAGGVDNTIQAGALNGAVGGGQFNDIQAFAASSTIGGGWQNTIRSNSAYAVIGGGIQNVISSNLAYSTLGGGIGNEIRSPFATIGGGGYNVIGTNSNSGTISGGYGHNVGHSSFDVAVGGGSFATVGTNSAYATIAGGRVNTIGDSANSSTIGGGIFNVVGANSAESVIGGGASNSIETNSVRAYIGGGRQNAVRANAAHSVIGGGLLNTIHPGADGSTIGGGYQNAIHTNAPYSTISGGQQHIIQAGSFNSTVGGGWRNNIGTNSVGGTIAGGDFNTIGSNANYAVIPGGNQNFAGGRFSLAAGYRAKANHAGSFVWADDTDADFSTTTNRQVALRANNGVLIQSTNVALDLRGGGAVRVPGSGLGAKTPVFIHRAVAANTSANTTYLDHPHSNGDPGAILLVTQNWNPPGGPAIYNAHPIGVWYTGSQWAIFNEDGAVMPINAAFNVLIIKP